MTTNAVFVTVAADLVPELLERYAYHCWDAGRHEVRWMTSFATSPDDVAGMSRW